MKKTLLLLLTILTVFTLSACKQGTEDDNHVVYTTMYPIQFLVEEIAGTMVEVYRVPGSTNSGHNDELHWTGKEIISMLNADLLFYVDAGLDSYISNSIDSVFSDGDVNLVNFSDEMIYHEVCYSHTHEHDEHGEELLVDEISMCEENALSEDPHFWISPQKMIDAARIIHTNLNTAFPEHATLFDTNFADLETRLSKLDDDYTEMASVATKPIITTNMLFNYWHSTYDIEIISLSTSAHNSEVVPGDVIEFVEEAVLHNIHYILYEANTNSPNGDLVLEQLLLQDDTAQKGYLHSLGNLSTEQVDNGANYLTLMYENLETLKEATK